MAEIATKRRRLQAGAACRSCHKKKIRCDGFQPQCSNCASRRIACDYDLTDGNQFREQSNGHETTQVQSSVLSAGLTSGTARSKRELPPIFEPVYSADGSHSSRIPAAQESNAPHPFFGDSSTFVFVSNAPRDSLDGVDDTLGQVKSPVEIRHQANDDEANTYVVESSFDLPRRAFADSLVDAYFDRFHKLYPFLHEGSFRAEYERMWKQNFFCKEISGRPWYAVLNMVFAHGCEFCGVIKHDEVHAAAAPFVDRARVIILSHVFKTGTLATVQTLLLMCYYLQGTVDLDECWNLAGLMTRTALSLGLHRTSGKDRYSPIEQELRKRAWCGCIILDRSLSMKFGRPLTLRLEEADVDLPLEVDDQYITNDDHPPRQPTGTPSFVSFFVSTIKLTHVIYNVLTELYLRGIKQLGSRTDRKMQTPAPKCNHVLSRVVLLDGQLQLWYQNAPSHLKVQSHDNTNAATHFQRQQIALKLRYLHISLLIHRPTFLYFSRNRIQDEFRRTIAVAAAKNCIQSARETIRLISTSYPRRHLNSLWFNVQYVFTSMCIISILKAMNKERRTLLDNANNDFELENLYRQGMELLQEASLSGRLGARYITILQQLDEQLRNENPIDRAVTENARPPYADNVHNPVGANDDFQTFAAGWPVYEPDDIDGFRLDFAGIEDLFTDIDPFWDSAADYTEYTNGL